MSNAPISAADAGLAACPACGLLSPLAGENLRCPRCGERLAARKPGSLSRTWALLIAAIILYLPANLLPVMLTTSLFKTEENTILSGVVYFWTTGSPALAALIFVFSIVIPILKMAALGYLAAQVQWGGRRSRRHCMTLYRLVEFVGRWSMLDVFVVALMVGLVRFHSLALVEAGSGAGAFGAVVVLTMLAAQSFDPRLIWDTESARHD